VILALTVSVVVLGGVVVLAAAGYLIDQSAERIERSLKSPRTREPQPPGASRAPL
jgi:hypothetical protein